MSSQTGDDDLTRLEAIGAVVRESFPVDLEGKAVDVYLRLLAEEASEALSAHDAARLATLAIQAADLRHAAESKRRPSWRWWRAQSAA